MADNAEEFDNPMCIIEVRLVTKKGVVFSARVGECLHNACHWMQENAEMLQELWDEHINDEPKITMEDVANPVGYEI